MPIRIPKGAKKAIKAAKSSKAVKKASKSRQAKKATKKAESVAQTLNSIKRISEQTRAKKRKVAPKKRPAKNSGPDGKLIITADDYGLSPACNQGIRDAVEAGVITSVQVMINFPGAAEEVEKLIASVRKGGNQCGIGLHLCTTAGPSSLQQESKLVRKLGNQYFFAPFTEAEVGRHLADIQAELTNQYRLLAKILGRNKIDSITSHHNIHYFDPGYFRVLVRLAQREKVPVPMRSPLTWSRDNAPTMPKYKDGKIGSPILFDAISSGIAMDKETRKRVKKGSSVSELKKRRGELLAKGIQHPRTAADNFYGVPSLRALSFYATEIRDVRRNYRPYTTEIFTHLSNSSKEVLFGDVTYGIDKRYAEYKVMMSASVRKFIAAIRESNTDYGSYQKLLNGRNIKY